MWQLETINSRRDQFVSLFPHDPVASTAQDPPKTAISTWLVPYTLADQLLVATKEHTPSDLSKRAISFRQDLHREVSNGARRAQKLSHACICNLSF